MANSRDVLLKLVRMAMGWETDFSLPEDVTIAQLPEHHDELLVPASEMLHIFIPFVFHYNSIKDSLRQELYELGEYIFSGIHRITDLLLDCKVVNSNRHRQFFALNLYI